jgi:hypothetical protein
MLSQTGRVSVDRGRRALESNWRREVSDRTKALVVPLYHTSPMHDLWVAQESVDVVHGCKRSPFLARPGDE